MNKAYDIKIKRIAPENIEEAFHVIWEVFQEFVAPDYTPEGINYFYSEFIKGEKFRKKFTDNREIMYGAYIGDELAGVLSISVMNTVSCVFVKGKYHRQGIGKKLFDMVIKESISKGLTEIRLNASPYAVPFYHAMGFQDTDMPSNYQGIIYTPMKLILM